MSDDVTTLGFAKNTPKNWDSISKPPITYLKTKVGEGPYAVKVKLSIGIDSHRRTLISATLDEDIHELSERSKTGFKVCRAGRNGENYLIMLEHDTTKAELQIIDSAVVKLADKINRELSDPNFRTKVTREEMVALAEKLNAFFSAEFTFHKSKLPKLELAGRSR